MTNTQKDSGVSDTMNVTGIIAEYNPFHNGHAFHIEETRKNTDADYCIAVISGSFVQRGAPALVNKYDRTKMALEHGIDLPVIAATSSAETFAQGGVCLLDSLGVVSHISFGAEANTTSDIDMLDKLADFFAFEPPAFQKYLDLELKSGYSFPAARAKAAVLCLLQQITPLKIAYTLLSLICHRSQSLQHLTENTKELQNTRQSAVISVW